MDLPYLPAMPSGSSLSFSIVVPTFQRRDIVNDAMYSLAKLEYCSSIEVIVVVDGSTDGTADALRELDLPFRLQVIEQANSGAASARNCGASRAAGDVVMFLDDDMIAAPDLVEQHARMYRESADAVIGHIALDPASPVGFLTDSVEKWIEAARVGRDLTPFDIFTGQLSVRRKVFEELSGFDESYTSGSCFAHEDTDFGVRLLARHRVRYNPQAITKQRYVVGPKELMRRSSQAAVTDLRFATAHPHFAELLFQHRRASGRRVRYLYRPLSRIPLLPKSVAAIAVRLGEAGLKTRFRSSTILRKFFGFAQGLSYWSEIRVNGGIPDAKQLLVLCYHAIKDQRDDPVLAAYGVPPEAFERQLDWLARRRFCFVSPDAVAAFLEKGSPLPRRAVLLTFDDCYASLSEVAKRTLEPRGIHALAFAVTGMASGTNEWDQQYGSNRVPLLDDAGLRELRELGIEIGSHSRRHREMPLLRDEELENEAVGSAADLAAMGLPRPRFFAYPFGSVDQRSIEAVRSAGYLAAFSCRSEHLTSTSDRFGLPRVGVFASDTDWRFAFKVTAPRLFSTLERLKRVIAVGGWRLGRRRGAAR